MTSMTRLRLFGTASGMPRWIDGAVLRLEADRR